MTWLLLEDSNRKMDRWGSNYELVGETEDIVEYLEGPFREVASETVEAVIDIAVKHLYTGSIDKAHEVLRRYGVNIYEEYYGYCPDSDAFPEEG